MKTDKRIDELTLAFQKGIDELAEIKKELKKEDSPEFEKGKWYKNPSILSGHWLGLFQGELDRDGVYGFNSSGVWSINLVFRTERLSEFIPATDKEVEKALIAEAEKRGFKEGVFISSIWIGDGATPKKSLSAIGDLLSFSRNKLSVDGFGGCAGYTLFEHGVWAEIADNKLTLNGKEVTIEDGCVNIGCVHIEQHDFQTAVRVLNDYDIDAIYHQELGEIKVIDLKKLIK